MRAREREKVKKVNDKKKKEKRQRNKEGEGKTQKGEQGGGHVIRSIVDVIPGSTLLGATLGSFNPAAHSRHYLFQMSSWVCFNLHW